MRRQKNPKKLFHQLSCSFCHKKITDINLLTEIDLEVFTWYVNKEQKKLENMNGLWKKTREYLCETCFQNYVKTLKEFYLAKNKHV